MKKIFLAILIISPMVLFPQQVITTPHGTVTIGAVNPSYTHFTTTLPSYYFDKPIYINTGVLNSYQAPFSLGVNGATIMTLYTNGYVGIGTVTPDARLDLGMGTGNGGAKFLWYNDTPGLRYGGTKSGIYLDLPGRGSHNVNLVFPTSSVYEGRFSISSKDTSVNSIDAYIDRVSVLGNGNVGIGTTTPNAKLHIGGDGYTLYGPNSTWGETLKVGGDGRGGYTGASVVATSGNLHLDAKDGSFATFINYYSENSTFINPNGGNVGIGTGDLLPEYKLHVKGNIASPVAVFENKDPNQYAHVNIQSDTGYLALGSLGSTLSDPSWQNSNYLYSSGKPKFQIKSSGSLVFATNGFAEVNTRMVIETNGNVGIGTSSPDEKLVVNGTIKATKISVVETIAAADFKIAGSDEWADYVFSEDYNLRSLSEVDNFINENGHLPEMPTAEEVSANGYELAKVNALLLKKIEELTLYTIELDKKIAALEGTK